MPMCHTPAAQRHDTLALRGLRRTGAMPEANDGLGQDCIRYGQPHRGGRFLGVFQGAGVVVTAWRLGAGARGRGGSVQGRILTRRDLKKPLKSLMQSWLLRAPEEPFELRSIWRDAGTSEAAR